MTVKQIVFELTFSKTEIFSFYVHIYLLPRGFVYSQKWVKNHMPSNKDQSKKKKKQFIYKNFILNKNKINLVLLKK